jgi:hypothetical protein
MRMMRDTAASGVAISPAYSMLVHTGATVLPRQVVIHTPAGGNKSLDLPGRRSTPSPICSHVDDNTLSPVSKRPSHSQPVSTR